MTLTRRQKLGLGAGIVGTVLIGGLAIRDYQIQREFDISAGKFSERMDQSFINEGLFTHQVSRERARLGLPVLTPSPTLEDRIAMNPFI